MTWQNAIHMHATTIPNVLDRATRWQGAGGVAEKNVHCGITARLNRGLEATKNKALLVLALLLALPILALSQSDPLSPAYLPSIDTRAADYPNNIWITDTMQKIRQDSGAPGTQHWGTFYGTQNEFVDFQVHVQAPAGGYLGLSVTTSDFVNSRTGTHILASSTNIVVYREAYVHVQGYPTNNQPDSSVPGGANYNTFYGGALGYYPDILIPAVDPYWHQTTNAWPFSVAAGKNQSAWVDVLIPPNAPSGYYLGAVTVRNGTTTVSSMPVILVVWQWPNASYMPGTPTLKTYLYNWTYDGLCTQMYAPATIGFTNCGSYPGGGGQNDYGIVHEWADATLLVKDHRYSMGGQTNLYPQSGSFSSFVSWEGPLLNGTCNLHNGSGTTCPLLAGSKLTTKSIDHLSTASSAVWSNWQSNFTSNGWGTAGKLPLLDGLFDEPHGSTSFTTLVNNAATRHGWLNPGVPEFVTTSMYWGQANKPAADAFSVSICGTATCIGNSIDIMTPPISTIEPIGYTAEDLSVYRTWLTGSTDSIPRQWWSYLSCTSGGTCSDTVPGPAPYGSAYTTWPNYAVDAKPAANRAMEWMTFLHGQTGEIYYAGDICATPSSGQNAGCTPSQLAVNYDPWSGIYYSGNWGDGTLVYAGGVVAGKVNYMGASVTTPLILPSMRLKHIRDGVQDYEYLSALTNAGKGSLVQTQIATWITNSYTFEASGAGLQTARIAIGKALHQLTYPLFLQPPTAPVGRVQ